MSDKMLICTHYERRPRPTGNFSIEAIFAEVRQRLQGKAVIRQRVSPTFSNGIFPRLRTIVDVWRHRRESLHITGDIHFAILGARKNAAILTIHDCGGLVGKTGVDAQLKRWIWFKWPVGRAARITTVSEATKRDIIAITGCPAGKIEVIPNAVSSSFAPSSRVTNESNPRILQVGTSYNKNIERLAAALAGMQCQLVVIGRLSPSQEAAIDANGIVLENHINLSESELVRQYQECDLVAFVSTFEGFGIPIVEAQRVGRPVVTSGCSSMPEVAGTAACFVDPLDVASIRAGIRSVIENREYRESLIVAGYENAKRFDANTIALQYLSVYRSVFTCA